MAVPDSCYDSSHDSLSYCWCSHADLCNSGPSLRSWTMFHISSLSVALSTYLLMWYIYKINISNLHMQCSYSTYPLSPSAANWLAFNSSPPRRHDYKYQKLNRTGVHNCERSEQRGYFLQLLGSILAFLNNIINIFFIVGKSSPLTTFKVLVLVMSQLSPYWIGLSLSNTSLV